MLDASSRLGPYVIVAPLGAGGMGEVYRARDTRLGREVAVKILPEAFASSPESLARFEREARAVAALSHPNILAIHDYGTHGAVTYAVMELLEGETLRARLSRGPLPWRESVEIGAAVADGLAAAQAKGIVHRDLKPENLFLTTQGRIKILDFGLARTLSGAEAAPDAITETNSTTAMGTVGYMSPEQVRGEPADTRSDVFALGCVLYEMATGGRAFSRATGAETMAATLHDEPLAFARSSDQAPAGLERIVRQCLAKDPNKRFQSPHDLALALRAVTGEPESWGGGGPRVAPLSIGVAVVLLAGVIGASVYLLATRADRPGSRVEPARALAGGSLAVLPFDGVAGNPETDLVCEGIADYLIAALSRLHGRDLIVRPLTSVAGYKGQGADARTVGRDLGVRTLVTGRLTERDSVLSITVALIDARENDQLWGKQYQGSRNEVLGLQEEMARDIAANLGLRLTSEEEERLNAGATQDHQAYMLYREGRYHWNKFTEAGLRKSIEYFARAAEKDPRYADAYAAMASAYNVLGINFWPPKEAFPRAKESLLKALAIDNTSAEVHSSLGNVLLSYDWDWEAADKEFRAALTIDPQLAHAHHGYSFYLAAMGRADEAAAALGRARELNPLAPIESCDLGNALVWARRYDQAAAACRRALEIDPNFSLAHQVLGSAYTHQGKYDEAIASFRKALEFDEEEPQNLGQLGYALAVSGKPDEARRILAKLRALEGRRYVAPYLIAYTYAGLRENSEAIAWLRKSFENRDPWLIFLKVDPYCDGLRTDARFAALLRDMRLEPGSS